ncbi:MAG: adenylate/guanylate cyclase domain-containing protein [Acidimicrobiales bacterium]
MTTGEELDADHLIARGLRDRSTTSLDDLRELVRYIISLGATAPEVLESTNLGELALDLILRPRGREALLDSTNRSGANVANVERLMTIAGLPSTPESLLTTNEVGAVELLTATIPGLLGDEAATQIARVAGNGMTRLAETLVAAFRLQVQLPHRDAGTPYAEIVRQYADIADTSLPALMQALEAILRRQIVAVTERVWSTDEERSAVTMLRTVGFVDLVGFTATTSNLSVRQLTTVLMEFDQWTADVITKARGLIIKTIGDEVMFVTEDATDACRIASNLVEARDGRLPPVRVGLATGEVISVFGDVYGPDVNLASRLVSSAEPATAVVSERTRRSVDDGIAFEQLETLTLKGFQEPITAFKLL